MDSAAASSLRGLIHQITLEKVRDLKVAKDLTCAHFTKALEEAKQVNGITKLKLLYKALSSCPVPPTDSESLTSLLKNLDALLNGSSQNSLGFGSNFVEFWVKKLESVIQSSLRRSEYSFLYGEILSQTLDAGAAEAHAHTVNSDLTDNTTAKAHALAEMETRFFSAPSPFNSEAFGSFLDKVFSFGEDVWLEGKFKQFRASNVALGRELTESNLDFEDVKASIEGLLVANLLSEDKNQTLRELKENSAALGEVMTLLSTRLKNVSQWNWEGVNLIDVRRDISGRYRAFMDEEIITAIFLQYIGAKWAVNFKKHFKMLHFHTRERRPDRYSIQHFRTEASQGLFCGTLPNSVRNQCPTTSYVNSETEEENPETPQQKGPTESKHYLLQLLANEIKVNHVHRPTERMHVVQTDFEWFGPSVNHQSVLDLMTYFHVPTLWVEFFEKFLCACVKLSPTHKGRTIRNGIPIAHSLSQVFGESLLFVLEFHVKRETGINLNRLYDDILFWNTDEERMSRAWEIINDYTSLTSLHLNSEKTGITTCDSGEELKLGGMMGTIFSGKLRSLIPREFWEHGISWGFVTLEPSGNFRIQNTKLAPFIAEMKQKLKESTSILEWTKCYNKYMQFFLRNFGSNAFVFGVQHVNEMIKAVEFIQAELFKEFAGNPVGALREQFNLLKNVALVDAWAFWPLKDGGLGLLNPLLDLIALNEVEDYKNVGNEGNNEASKFSYEDLPKTDFLNWNHLCEQQRHKVKNQDHAEGSEEVVCVKSKVVDLISFEDYCARRETHSKTWRERFDYLMTKPNPAAPFQFCDQNGFNSTGMQDSVHNRWIFAAYSSQIQDLFGTFAFINTKLIPVSMISQIMNSKLSFKNDDKIN